MTWRRLTNAVAPFGMLAVLACGGAGSTAGSSPTPTPTPSPTPPPVVAVSSAQINGKPFLTDTKGMTLYLWQKDKGSPTKANCTGACLAVWPPFLLPSGVTKATGPSSVTGAFTTIDSPDGKGTQVVYNGWPLYYYAKDKNPGDTLGQGVGGNWFVVPPDVATNTAG